MASRILSWRLGPTVLAFHGRCPGCSRWQRIATRQADEAARLRDELGRLEATLTAPHASHWAPEPAA